jgi:hypothetical protein
LRAATRRFLYRILDGHFWTARASQRRRLRLRLRSGPGEVVVYQMGKVGSTSVAASITALYPEWTAHHLHQLTHEQIRRLERSVRESFADDLVTPRQRSSLMKQLVSAEHLRRHLDAGSDHRRWKVVTLVRDPVARNLSGFFEILDLQLGYGLEGKLQSRGRDAVLRELPELFFSAFPDHDQPLTFFEREFGPALGFDIYSAPFPRETGWAVYRHDRLDVLVLRLEDLDRCFHPAFTEFLGTDRIQPINANVGAEKGYRDLYREMRRSIPLPEDYLGRMYGSRYAQHFYTPDELRGFRDRWNRSAA